MLFQKFLRENRFKLLSNGIAPPAEIFASSSFASIDIQLVAVWLLSLADDERERFHLLKARGGGGEGGWYIPPKDRGATNKRNGRVCVTRESTRCSKARDDGASRPDRAERQTTQRDLPS